MKNRDTTFILARGRELSTELYNEAIRSLRRIYEALGEDAEPTINDITTRYLARMAAADEAARDAERVPSGVHARSRLRSTPWRNQTGGARQGQAAMTP